VISSVRGEVSAVSASACVIDVGGMGYSVSVTPEHAASLRVGEVAKLSTTLIVREDSMQLFGFQSSTEQGLFDALLSVSGVGPRSAMSILSQLTPLDLYLAVVHEDDGAFKKVSGIGPKTAKLIIVSLAGKLSALADLDSDGAGIGKPSSVKTASASSISESVVVALTGLGWNERSASDAVRSVLARDPGASAAAVLREALLSLGSAPSSKVTREQ
jgi:Holliday junction DNA helicase RuvA